METRTIIYHNVRYGDWLHCNNCEQNMLLPIGADKCPECGAEGVFRWVSGCEKFYTADAKDIGFPNYVENEVSVKDCFSDNVSDNNK